MFFLSNLSLKYQSTLLSSSIGKVVFSVPTLYMLERRPYKTGGVAGVWVSLYQCGDPVVCQTSRVRISGPRVPVVRTLFPATLLLCQPITAPILNPTVECVQETSIGPKILECT